MRKIFICIILVTGLVMIATAQDRSCFKNCMSQLKALEDAGVQWPLRNQKVTQGLVGCKAPDFKEVTIKGDTLRLSDLKGKIVVLNFWFIGCAPCVAEMPALNKLVDEYGNKNVVFIAFGTDDPKRLKEFLEKHQFTYHIVASDKVFADQYCLVEGWPMNMVIDKAGIVRQVFSGGRTDEAAKTHAYDLMKPTIEKYLDTK